MLDLFKLAISKPLHAIVAALCVVTITIHLGLFEVRKAVAVIQSREEEDRVVHKLVYRMHETLIRIDENVKVLKQNKEK